MEDVIQVLNRIIDLYHLAEHADLENPKCESDLHQQLHEKIQSLKTGLDAILFESHTPVENIIRYHQNAIHHFAHSLRLEDHRPSGKTKMFECAFNEIFAHLLNYFYAYIDSEKILPASFSNYFLTARNELIERQLCQLSGCGIGNNLIDSLKDYLNTFKNRKYLSLNYNQLVYLQEILLMLSCIDFRKNDIEELLSHQLLKLNFNHLIFFRYLQSKMLEEMHVFDSSEKKIEYLKMESIKILNGKTDISCYKEWPSIQELLAGWINEERDMISKSTAPLGTRQTDTEEKIYLNVSVAQLACIVKCFYEETAHYSVTIKSILRLITQKIATKRQAEISYKSLSKCYYAVDQSTAASVLGLLEKMTSKIKKSYFS